MIDLNAPYVVESISWSFNGRTGALLPVITVRAVVDGPDGDTLNIPDIPGFPATKYRMPSTMWQVEYRCLYSEF